MSKIKIITDNCCSLSKEELEKLDIDYVQMGVVVDDNSYLCFEHPTTDKEKFYKDLQKAGKCSTSCVNIQTFYDVFEKYVKDGYDVFYVGLSGGLSCTFNNSVIAKNEINEKYGEHVFVADSLSGSFGIAKMVLNAVELAKNGKSAKEIYRAIDKNNMKVYPLFAPGDLKFLMRSGRLSKLAASVGTLLKIVPIITTDDEGKLKVIDKCMGRKRAMRRIQDLIIEKADLDSIENIYIGHTGQEQEAKDMAEFIKANMKNKQVEIGYIDYTMGCNCGPETLAIFVTKK